MNDIVLPQHIIDDIYNYIDYNNILDAINDENYGLAVELANDNEDLLHFLYINSNILNYMRMRKFKQISRHLPDSFYKWYIINNYNVDEDDLLKLETNVWQSVINLISNVITRFLFSEIPIPENDRNKYILYIVLKNNKNYLGPLTGIIANRVRFREGQIDEILNNIEDELRDTEYEL